MTLIGEARGVDLGNLAQAYNALYQVGVRGEHILKAKNPYISMLTPEQVGLAYTYGQMDGLLERGKNKNSSEVLQKVAKDAKINNNKESGDNEQGVRLRDGSERDGGQDPGGQVSAVESGTGQDQSRGEGKSRPRDREAASLTYGEEVSAKSRGIKGGLDSGKVYLLAEGSETNEMKKARARAEKRGKKVTFFAGGNLRIEQGDVVISARGYIEGDNVYVRVDHPYYTADQLMRHELGHDMIARGEVNVDEVRERISDRFEDVDFIVERYTEAYEGSGLDADEIWEEIICDSLGDMNIFAPVEVLGEMNDEFLEVLKEETRKSQKDARGPPRSAEGKASRETASNKNFVEDKYFGRQIDKFEDLKQGGYITVGEIVEGSPLNKVGIPHSTLYFDVSKILQEMKGRNDAISREVIKEIPNVLNNPIVITEYVDKNGMHSVNVYGNLYIGSSPVVVGVMITQTQKGNIISKIQTVHANRHALNEMTDDNILYLSENKKETKSWFQSLGTQELPLGGSRFGFIRSISQTDGFVNKKSKKDSVIFGKSGKTSQDLDFVDFLNENLEERERSNREILANLLETEDMSPSEKGFLTKYKNKIAQIEANEAEISEMESELKELRKAGKKDSSRAITLEGKIEARRKEIARDENMILNLESTNSIKRLLKREKDAAYAEGMLAGQMAQGKDDAAKLRRAEERLAEQKRKDGETLTEYKKRVAEREAEIKQKNRERLAAQREKARENLDAQAKRYQESRKKATEGRHKTAMRHKIAGVVSELDKLLRKGTKERNVKIGLQDAVASALELFDMNEEKVERYNKAIADLDARIAAATDPVEIEALTELREKKVRNSERLADKLQVMKKAYEDIHNGRDGENYPSYYKAECEAIENRIAEVMEKVGDTPIGDMSLEQLEAVYDMYRMVLTTVQNANKVFKNGKLADLTADATDMTSELQRIKKLAEERLKAGDDIRSFVWNELTPYYAFNRIGSETLMSYYEELIRGQDVYAEDLAEAQKFAEETREKYGYGKWKLDKVHSFKDKDGRDFRLTLRHMMSIYAYSKREQAFDHMEKGGFFFNNKETFRKKAGVLEFIASNESGYKVDARIFAQIKGALNAEQIAYVDEMQAYLTKMGEKGNEVTRVMWGIDIFKEAVYFPLKSKEDFIYQANTPAETSSLKNDGMTKETKPHASNPIVLEAFDDVWANHVEKMSKYHGFVIPIDNLNKLINYGTWMSGESQVVSSDTQNGQFSKKVLQKQSDGDIIRADADSLRRVENGTERTDEFRELQKRSREMSDEDSALYHNGSKKLDSSKREGLRLAFEKELSASWSSKPTHQSSLVNRKTGKTINILEGIDGNLFHDIFEIARIYLQNGELVDLHDNYDNATCYISNDGLCGFAIENDGNLVSVFNLGDGGFLDTIAQYVKDKGATHLDCYNSAVQPLTLMYERKLGFKTASIMDYNMEYDHDDIAKNHGMPKVAFMVNTEAEIETREFDKDQYDEAVEYQHSFVEDNNADTNRNFSTNSEMGSHSISTMLEARFGPGVNEYLNTFIKDLNGAKAQSGGIMGGVFNLLSKFKKTSVAASLSVVVQQPTAIIRALSEIDARYFVGMPKPEILNRKWERMKKYAPIVILKDIGGFDAGSGRSVKCCKSIRA